MSGQTKHRDQVERVAEIFRSLLKRPDRRPRGTFASPRLVQLEKAIGNEQIKTARHLAELFCGWIDEGVSADAATQFFRVGETVIRAYATRPVPPDEAALAAKSGREIGDVFAAIPTYFERRTEGTRRDLAKQVVEARDALGEFGLALHRSSLSDATTQGPRAA
jgi:hypothetical protein